MNKLPRQNSAWIGPDGLPTRDFYNWARSIGGDEPADVSVGIGQLNDVIVQLPSDGQILVYDDTFGVWMNEPQPSNALTSTTSAMSADVNLSVSGTWYQGPSVSLTSGTWLVTGFATFYRSTATATTWFARLSNGVNFYASSQLYSTAVIGQGGTIPLSAIITLSSSATISIQATTNAGAVACLMKAATTAYGSGNNSTVISAVKLA